MATDVRAGDAPAAVLHGVRAVVFDLDGTLVDAFDDIAAATNHALTALGLPTHSYPVVRSFVGKGVRNLAARALGDPHAHRVDEFILHLNSYYKDHPADHSRPYPGASETLDALRAAGIRTALLSNKPHPLTVRVLSALDIAPRLDLIQGEVAELGTKPDPRGLFSVLERLGVAPAEAVFVGDGEPDAEVARRARVRFVGVAHGILPADRLAELGALRVLDRLPQFLPLLGLPLPGIVPAPSK